MSINTGSKPRVVRFIEDLTSDWLAGALDQPVSGFSVKPVGTGQSGATFRVTLEGDGDVSSVILKIADPDPAVRRTGVMTGNYEREVDFFGRVADRLPQTVLARCYAAGYDADGGFFSVLMEDLAPAEPGDQLAGCTVEQARTVVRELARIVASVVEDSELSSWLDEPPLVDRTRLEMMLPAYYERFGSRISDADRDVIDRFVAAFDTWVAERPGLLSVWHGDFRLDNMMFGERRELAVVDWATVGWGPLTGDLAFFLGGSLTAEDRRAHERELVELFHQELLAAGVADHSVEECWDAYRWMTFSGILMAVAAPLVVTETERGDEMFLMMLERHCEQVRDVDALGLLGAARRAAVQVDPGEEDRHQPGGERFWNESWYMDAISADGKLGAYVRVGYVPHLKHTVYTAYIVGEGRPSIAVVEYEAPLPAEGLKVTGRRFESEMIIEQPLKRFRVTMSGTGEAHDDSSAPLRHERGRDVAVELDLMWATAGDPYMYDITPRYELPCQVTGTLKVGDETLTFEGPGQRDHSWGDRNWWMHDWCWASAHLDDGTRLQVVELRLPGIGVAAAGYEQHRSELTEIKGIAAAYEIAANREPGRTQVTLEPSGTQLEWQPIAYGNIRVDAPDGRVCEFPRAMARVRTADGRTGLGWVEWGTNVDPSKQPGGPTRQRLRAVAQRAQRLAERTPQSLIERVMGSNLGPRLISAIFRALPRRIDVRRATVIDATVRFKIGDETTGKVDAYDLNLSVDRPPTVTRPHAGSPAPGATLTISAADFVALGLGRLDALQAALQRRLILEGDTRLVATVVSILAGDAFPPQQPLRPQ